MTRSKAIGWELAWIMSGLVATLVWAEAPDSDADSNKGSMNGASDEAKIDAIAAVVNELVAQRRTRRDHMEERWNREQRPSGKPKSGAGAP